MEYINSVDLELIGQGANGKVYKYNKLLVPSGLSAVVKISRLINPSKWGQGTVLSQAIKSAICILFPSFVIMLWKM